MEFLPKEASLVPDELVEQIAKLLPTPKPPSAEKVPLILFSGGLDSTFLLYEQLKHSDVDILYVSANQAERKKHAELGQRRKIINWLAHNAKDHGLYEIRRDFRMDMRIEDLGRAVVFHQVMPWFHAALNHADPRRHNEVQMAYVMGDEICGELSNIQKGWEFLTESLLGGPVALTFPLRRVRKTEIIRQLPKELFEMVWFCELPLADYPENTYDYKVCGTCSACVTHKQARERVALEDACATKNSTDI